MYLILILTLSWNPPAQPNMEKSMFFNPSLVKLWGRLPEKYKTWNGFLDSEKLIVK